MYGIKDIAVSSIAGGFLAAFITLIINFLGSILPILGLLNLCCFLWIIAGGFVAVYMLRDKSCGIEMKDGAIVGLLSGIVYAVIVTSITSILFSLDADASMMHGGYGNVGFLVGAVLSLIVILNDLCVMNICKSVGEILSMIFIIIIFVINLILGIVLGAIGGVMGAAVLKE
ncbi:MAG: hypothetical protein DRO90_02905 [Candidatus Altiarchaeales archaeon]|nr:MAG: hypothetical protein DRO95_04655 [Candidatus Altiarchaeales archaeon]RLI93887.1 MAG: hypothetical protein DRO94_04185 [Candidatus Altiarchaeales archaeon]RLI93909.1 MAG: hypothetical protein DRO90_02905 [Candidatus Altiarchaeales archaeon]HDO82077.1 hypothetical protein [Candidatus Altiarchaeales archaeon]HEX54726.1 hypothetical protein [Candidatus Altiarchaeales archaeon]